MGFNSVFKVLINNCICC